jgi:hypothetical protein
MPKLTFSAQTARKRPIAPMPDKYRESKLRPNIEESDGLRPHMPTVPLKFLDVKYQDITTEQYVVIPKGRIVSAITAMNEVAAADALNLSTDTDVPVGTVNQIDGSTPLVVGADSSYYGYSRDIAGLLVPANGGIDRVITYDATDVSAYVPNAISNAVVAAGETYTLPANAPIGIAFQDVYQDIRGAHLNYEMWKSYGILSDRHLKLFFVDFGILKAETGIDFTAVDAVDKSGYKTATVIGAGDEGYAAVENKYSFLYFDSTAATGNVHAAVSGQLLKSDLYGNWVPQGAAEATLDHSLIDLSATRNAQTVGRLLYCDTRYPKDLLETVETPWGRPTSGSGTEGLTDNLFDFIVTILNAKGFSFVDGAGDPKDAAKFAIELVQAGAFGYAHIQLMAR